MDHGVSWCFGTSLAPSTTGRASVCLLSFHSGSAKHCATGGYAAGLTSTRLFGGLTHG